MRILLVSTYELGHQPIHLASPAAALKSDGHRVSCLDLAVDEADLSVVEEVDAVAFSVPMHTAMRLAVATAGRIKEARPDLPIAFYGLYADVGRERTLGSVADAIFCGEYEPGLRSWVAAIGTPDRVSPVQVHLGRSEFMIPDRTGLPTLDRYAHLEYHGQARVAAAVEASHGCRHRCRHCPIPAVYDGRLRVVGEDLIQRDIDQLVALGAEHITFADADFLNAPAYSLAVLRSAHAAHPELTFDATIKVEHILKHRELWPEMASLNLLFVVSAFESVDNATLDVLDKGHTVEDMVAATSILRDSRVFLRPTWLPFLPWTAPGDIARIFQFLDANQLAGSVDPVQMAIRVLIPDGSLLAGHPRVEPYLSQFDPAALTWVWDFEDPETGRLHKELDQIAADASDCKEDAGETLVAMRSVVSEISGIALAGQAFAGSVPRLSESWFCCAEPTAGQATAISGVTLGQRR